MRKLRHAPACFLLALSILPYRPAPDLKPHTLEAFLRYAQVTEVTFLQEVNSPDTFLRLDRLSGEEGQDAREKLGQGEVFMMQLKTRDESDEEIKAKNGIIHHWYGVVFVPGATMEQALELVQDYDRHEEVYAPEVDRSRTESHSGNDFEIYYRFKKKKVITAVLDTWHSVRYTPLAADRVYSISKTTKVQEVENAGKDDERLKPPDVGRGFMWRINSYWRFLERDDGIYIECESVSLTRDIPLLARPIISPFVRGVPRELLTATLENTSKELGRSGGP